MSEVAEAFRGLFSLVVSLFVLAVVYQALFGGDIAPLVNFASELLPAFVIGLILVFLALEIVKNV